MLVLKQRITNYWTKRSTDFCKLRKEELDSYMASLWLKEINDYLEEGKQYRILDVGTGGGFFAILLAKEGHLVDGIDLTASMIEGAKNLAQKEAVDVNFAVMDAEILAYADETFDIVITRNLTWTLPNPQKAYREWHRVLKSNGLLLNFDADYGKEKFAKDASLPTSHVHNLVAKSLMEECDTIKNNLAISKLTRPNWDIDVLNDIGYEKVNADTQIGKRLYTHKDNFYNPAPVFLISAVKN